MEKIERRLPKLILATAAAFCLMASPALALDFTVHSYDLGERISLQSGRNVWTAELDVSLDTVADHVASFCVDLDTYIGVGTYTDATVLDAYTDGPGLSPSGPRDFAWAGHVMTRFGYDVDQLVGGAITRNHAITGVQAAIWEGLYGGAMDTIERSSLSVGARDVFDRIMNEFPGAIDGGALIVDLRSNQDQIIANPVPEPSAALVFGLGTVVASSVMRRRER